ncbi:MAG: ABC transporter substrate binding protein, partial [Chthoniobacterales bacterium]
RNIQIEYRFAGGNLESINKYVAEVIGLTPDVIVANSTPVIAALQASKTTTPIVFAMVNDPVGQGFLPSLAHPGGNDGARLQIESDPCGTHTKHCPGNNQQGPRSTGSRLSYGARRAMSAIGT